MAYLKDIRQEMCYRCRKKATVELYNHRNALLNYYCARCGKAALRMMKESEGQEV